MKLAPQKYWRMAERVYQKWGYLTFACYESRTAGEVFTTTRFGVNPVRYKLRQPFRIIGEGTREEFIEQAKFVGWQEHIAAGGANFYRAVTE